MTQRPAPDSPAAGSTAAPTSRTAPLHETGDLRQALLASLGLPADATPEAVETAHERVASYLTAAPAELEGWARQQAAAADAAHAVLTGKAGDVLSRRATPAAASPATTSGRPGWQRAMLNPLLLLLVIAAIVVGVWKFGGDGGSTQAKPPVSMGDQGSTEGGAMPTSTPTPLDAAKVKDLEAKVAANAKDTASMAALANMYYQAEKFDKAAEWRKKILALEPNNKDVLLSTGVAMLNAGDPKGAEKLWNKVLQLDPKNAEAYYDLGFLQLMSTPSNTAKAKEYWDKVVELDGNGPLSQKVQNHMGALMTPAPTAPAPTSSK